MTREQAEKIVMEKCPYQPSIVEAGKFIDMAIALGMLKLSEPKPKGASPWQEQR